MSQLLRAHGVTHSSPLLPPQLSPELELIDEPVELLSVRNSEPVELLGVCNSKPDGRDEMDVLINELALFEVS